MNRRQTTADITWFLELERTGQLDLNPPYQRRSVWTRKDRQFFLDTIFRDFPSPAIFLYKSISDDEKVTYHVVDGKQRLETILAFAKNKLRVAKDFGDVRLDGKNWKDLRGESKLRRKFWDYSLPVEFLPGVDGTFVNEVFDRLNRNSRKLTRQELRHAKFDGWFIHLAESEAEDETWKLLGVVTTARAKRMSDVQFISELLLVLLRGELLGFDQDGLDDFYASYDLVEGEYEEPEDWGIHKSQEKFMEELLRTKIYVRRMEIESGDLEAGDGVIQEYARSTTNFYTLWSVVALARSRLPEAAECASRYRKFMKKVSRLNSEEDLKEFLKSEEGAAYGDAFVYWQNMRGANTDLTQRKGRFDILRRSLVDDDEGASIDPTTL